MSQKDSLPALSVTPKLPKGPRKVTRLRPFNALPRASGQSLPKAQRAVIAGNTDVVIGKAFAAAAPVAPKVGVGAKAAQVSRLAATSGRRDDDAWRMIRGAVLKRVAESHLKTESVVKPPHLVENWGVQDVPSQRKSSHVESAEAERPFRRLLSSSRRVNRFENSKFTYLQDGGSQTVPRIGFKRVFEDASVSWRNPEENKDGVAECGKL